jgi:hypothetical protein
MVQESIIPTLEMTETTRRGYAKHMIPLVLENGMVLNALVAASAGHMRAVQKGPANKAMQYRVHAEVRWWIRRVKGG